MAGYEINAFITALINRRWDEVGMDYCAFRQLTGFKPARISKLLDGGAFLRPEWVDAIANALQIDRLELTLLSIEQHLDAETARFLQDRLASVISGPEWQWLGLIRVVSVDQVREPSTLQRRVIEALLAEDGESSAGD